MLVKITLLYILLGMIVFLVLWYNVQLFLLMFRSNKQAIYVPSFTKDLSLMCGQLPLSPGKKLIDLGCGDGKALRFFVREYKLKCRGYDINFFAVWYGRIINWLKGYDIALVRSNFLGAHVQEADYVYLYLFPEQMLIIEDRIFATIKKDALIISNTFQFQKHRPSETIRDHKGKERIFLYRK